MKNKIKNLKIWLVALLFMSLASGAYAQTEGTINTPPLKVGPGTIQSDPGRVSAITPVLSGGNVTYETANSVLFYNPVSKPGMTLTASRVEDFTGMTPLPTRAPENFTHYRWFYMGQTAGGTTAVDGTTFNTDLEVTGALRVFNTDGNKLTITNLTEGYHYFKVRGIINPDNIAEEELCTVKEEIYVVYVLPQLVVTSAATLTTGSSFQYCETDVAGAATQSKVKIDATYDFARSNTPVAGDFEVKYRWYAVKQEGGNWPDVSTVATNPTSITGVTLLETSTTNASLGTLPIFNPQIEGIGKYKVFVEVEYAIKDRNANNKPDVGNIRARDYVIYRGLAQDGVKGDMILTITPAPGKPHITIEAVND